MINILCSRLAILKNLTALMLLVVTLIIFPARLLADPYDDAVKYFLERKYDAVVKVLEPGAKNGNERYQLALGLYYSKRQMYDYELARYWFMQAANNNYAEAQEVLGTFIMCGSTYFQKDCAGNYTEGLKLHKLAFNQYEQRAAKGICSGYERMANYYFYGIVVPKDVLKGRDVLRDAGFCGNADAARRLALFYTDTRPDPHIPGFPIDFIKGYAWAIIASAKGPDYAVTASRDRIEAELTPQQIRQGQLLARECLESDFKRCKL